MPPILWNPGRFSRRAAGIKRFNKAAMEIIKTDTISGAVSVPVYSYLEIPFLEIMLEAKESRKRVYDGKKFSSVSYLEIPCAFDIETTNIYKRIKSGKNKGKIDPDFRPFAFMYQWQFCIGFRVVFGRTWREFTSFLSLLEKNMNLSNNLRLVVYCHNLSYEMQFMRRFLNVTDSFCKAERQPLKAVHNGCIEFRCSAALSNMSLKMFCKSENARFYKMADAYDYTKIRTAETQLTPEEKSYCYNDVRGLCECIQSLMRFDTLATIPMTSTGYVRRDARIAVKKNKANRRIFRDSSLEASDYNNLRAAFRGGDTHANARFANQLLNDVTSFDIASSYPACMMINKFPMSKFTRIRVGTFRKLLQRGKDKFCFLLHVAFRGNVRCIADHGIPYIPLAKTKHLTNDRILDNGRVLKASEITLWVTGDDLDIILEEYAFEEMRIESVYVARAGMLPAEYRDVVMDYFRKKTRLKGKNDPESVYLYNKSKNRLNALYGMMVMRLDQSFTTYTGKGDSGYETELEPLEETLKKYYNKKNNFLAYQWGVWVTSAARKRLHVMMQLIGNDLVYIDTDSVKFLNYEKHKEAIEKLNKKLEAEAIAAGAFADDPDRNRHYMGVFEFDGKYDQLKTLGAKKYVVNINGECYSTIAGVSKAAGQRYFNKHGLDSFRIGAVIEDSGHLVAYYNDDEIHEIEINGCKMTTASNVALIDDTYTIGVTGDYLSLIQNLESGRIDLS